MRHFLQPVHDEWRPLLERAFQAMDAEYLDALNQTTNWLPGTQQLLASFSRPLQHLSYVLLGESPYPRMQSANGYAFWDAAVGDLWGPQGLSTSVNRATSLRNFIKMLLHARGDLQHDYSKPAIMALDKSAYVKTASQFFTGLLDHGFLLLNACLVYRHNEVPMHARFWQPFMKTLFQGLLETKPQVQLILLGKVAQSVPETEHFVCVVAEHPYNISFITNPNVIDVFKPMDLLKAP